jgi:hypothetical protein
MTTAAGAAVFSQTASAAICSADSTSSARRRESANARNTTNTTGRCSGCAYPAATTATSATASCRTGCSETATATATGKKKNAGAESRVYAWRTIYTVVAATSAAGSTSATGTDDIGHCGAEVGSRKGLVNTRSAATTGAAHTSDCAGAVSTATTATTTADTDHPEGSDRGSCGFGPDACTEQCYQLNSRCSTKRGEQAGFRELQDKLQLHDRQLLHVRSFTGRRGQPKGGQVSYRRVVCVHVDRGQGGHLGQNEFDQKRFSGDIAATGEIEYRISHCLAP